MLKVTLVINAFTLLISSIMMCLKISVLYMFWTLAIGAIASFCYGVYTPIKTFDNNKDRIMSIIMLPTNYTLILFLLF